MKKTVILDPMPDLFWEKVKKSGWGNYIKSLDDSNLLDIEIAVIRTITNFNYRLFSELPQLSLIIRAGSGYDNIDLQEAQKRKVRVCTTPEANKKAAFEHTLSLILALLKGHQFGKDAIESKRWKQSCSRNWEITDLKALIVGAGRIGSLIADTLTYYGAEVRITDPYLHGDFIRKKGYHTINYRRGLNWCNLLTFHCPLSWETRDYFSMKSLDWIMQPIWLVNTARGSIVNEKALKSGLEQNKILGAALDVFDHEPWWNNDLVKLKNLYLTPHTGAYTGIALDRLVTETLNTWYDYCFKDELKNEVDYRFFNKIV